MLTKLGWQLLTKPDILWVQVLTQNIVTSYGSTLQEPPPPYGGTLGAQFRCYRLDWSRQIQLTMTLMEIHGGRGRHQGNSLLLVHINVWYLVYRRLILVGNIFGL